MKPSFGLVARTGVVPTWPYLDTHGPLARTVADARSSSPPSRGRRRRPAVADRSTGPARPAPALRDDALAGVRLGVVEAHAPRAQMTAAALAAWDRAVDDLRAAGAAVDAFAPAVTRVDYRDAFAAAARARGDAPPDANAPAPTANALLQYFAGRAADPRAALRRGYAAYRAYYDVLPATYEACEPLLGRPVADDPAGRSFGRARARVVEAVAASMRAAGVAAMVYPTMPFAAPRATDRGPTSAPRSATATGSACPRCRSPPAWAPTACRRSTCRWSAFRRRRTGAGLRARVRAAVAALRGAAARTVTRRGRRPRGRRARRRRLARRGRGERRPGELAHRAERGLRGVEAEAEVLVAERREQVGGLVPVRVPAVAHLRAALVLAQADRGTRSWNGAESVLVMWLPTAPGSRWRTSRSPAGTPTRAPATRRRARRHLELDVHVGLGPLLRAQRAVGARHAVVEEHHVVLDHPEPRGSG
jgi:hypothetical protein